MKSVMLLFIMLIPLLPVKAQQVTDANGLTGVVVDKHVNKIYKVTYVQVLFDFDSITWGVYLITDVVDDAAMVVKQGNLLKMKTGSELYPLSDEWKYITRKQWKLNTKPVK